jgi:predicted nucleic acid-binding protein
MVGKNLAMPIQAPDGSVVAVDSAPIIYFLEGHPRFCDRFAPIFEAADAGRIEIVISAITVAEVLSGPIARGLDALAARYREALTSGTQWRVLPVDSVIAEDAARLRARYRLRLPDALQVATALRAGADMLVTHDRRLKKIRELTVVGLA